MAKTMNNRERILAVLNYLPYDRLPLLHFGFWREALYQWAGEGHLSEVEARDWADGNPTDAIISRRLGFDSNWSMVFHWKSRLVPPIEETVVEEHPDGSCVVLNEDGMWVLKKFVSGAGRSSTPRCLPARSARTRSASPTCSTRMAFSLSRWIATAGLMRSFPSGWRTA